MNKENGELIYIDSTIGNDQLAVKHITAAEKKRCVVAKRSECWIISPIKDGNGQVKGSNLKRVYNFDYGGNIPDFMKGKLAFHDLKLLVDEIELIKNIKAEKNRNSL